MRRGWGSGFCKSLLPLIFACGSQGPAGPPGPEGEAGPPGPPGLSPDAGTAASLSLFGDGAGGPLVVDVDGGIATVAAFDLLKSYSSITINSGTILLPSGARLRCTGPVTIGQGASLQAISFAGGGSQTSPANPGISVGASGPGDYGTSASAVYFGGPGGMGVPQSVIAGLLVDGPLGGGGGGYGARGGGTLTIFAGGDVDIEGTVKANGEDASGGSNGGGGGGGGVIQIASAAKVTMHGTVEARGGKGQDGDAAIYGSGPGGGGGGGLVRFVAPQFVLAGTVNVSAGTAGAAMQGPCAYPTRHGGGGGGACIGNGGVGGWANGNSYGTASDGQPGQVIQNTLNPSELLW